MLAELRNVSKRFGGLRALDGVTIAVPEGSITGLIGPNGAGKSTLFAVLAGFVALDSGHVSFDSADVTQVAAHLRARRGIARTFQVVQPFAGLSVRENIAVGAYLRHPDPGAALAHAEAVARQVGLAPALDQEAASLTVAGRKRLELARALATGPRLLLLDEVLAGLNPSEVRDMIPVVRAIRDGGVTIFMVEHVLQAVMSLCEQVHVLAEGKLIAAGTPRAVCDDPGVVEAYLGHGAAGRLRAAETADA